MQTFFWSFMTYGVLVTGVAMTALIFSGVQMLERLGAYICSLGMGIGGSPPKHRVHLRLPLIASFIAGVTLFMENTTLVYLKQERAKMTTLSGLPDLRARVLRHQRNWWIAVASLLIWAIVWRFTGVVKRYRDEIKRLKDARKALSI
eukprot:Protomagalhaensia_wolfi_Nauph_80__262@NODE_1148_length_1697_cov_51_161037_g876_i0_p2_GENE_NODE_1148_length_1697_cov_51_161037_g876_i0NODE_1148_length_1697_cov_51_161037_g876_i0_p2_ORF_typecomplete_len147_score16_88Bap31/PF05529_12/5_3e03Bap31/PF05529_12/1_4e07DUF1772/PF08592_11/7_3e02DUF1772/PF08592_11/0_071MMPL/PF03176_15/3_7MMPL/PF03176_15/1_2e02_NODE_1148_length_1697_cov_51_161037_g876_i010931533